MSLPKLFSVLVTASVLLLSPAVAQTLARGHIADRNDALAYADALEQLRTRRLSVSWKETSLAEVVRELRVHLARGIVFSPAAGDRREIPVSLELNDVSAASIVRLLQPLARVRFLFEGGMVFVTTPEDAAQRCLEIRVFDLSDLIYRAPDFPGPTMDLHPGRPGPAPRDVDAGSRDGTEIVDLLRTLVGPEPWDVPGASITISHHLLIVRQTPEVHRKIAELVAALAALL